MAGGVVRVEGTCKWFNAAKGIGFAVPDEGGGDCFIHYSVIEKEGYRTLAEGERISFEICEGPKGRYAESVRPLP